MLDWIAANANALNVIFSGVTVLVWAVYLHLILIGFLRQTRSEIIIAMGGGRGLAARCFLTNLGQQPVHISDVVVGAQARGAWYQAVLTDPDELAESARADPLPAVDEAPLKSGEMHDLGTFSSLIGRLGKISEDMPVANEVDRIEIIVIATSAVSTRLVAARRCFTLGGSALGLRLRPVQPRTEQIRSRLRVARLTRRIGVER